MPEFTYTTTVSAPIERVWGFVKDMSNWAPFVSGYQRHEIFSETDSLWVLRGDMGMLSRSVELGVHIDEWIDQQRVRFTLCGKNEPVRGGGVFTLSGPGALEPAPVTPSWWQRVRQWIATRLHALLFGPKQTIQITGGGQSTLTFELKMESTGPTAPLVNAMLAPLIGPACEHLATQIAHHISDDQTEAP